MLFNVQLELFVIEIKIKRFKNRTLANPIFTYKATKFISI